MSGSTDEPKKSRARVLRRVLIGGGIVVGLLIVAAVLAVALIPAEKIQQIAFEQLEANTGLRGSATGASVSLFPLGAKLEGLRIDDPSDASTAWEDLEIELESALVRASLLSILKGEPQISEVRLVRPRVAITLAAPPEGTEGAGDAGAPSEVAAALGLVSIVDGAITVTQPTGQVIELTGLDNAASLQLAAGRATGTVEGSLQRLVVRGGDMVKPLELPRLEWELDVNAQIDGLGGTLGVDRIEMSGLRADGTASWTGRAPEFDVALNATADVAQLWSELGRDFVDVSTLPPGLTLDDFDLVAGTMTADVVYQGAVPAADPDDPTAALRPLQIQGVLKDGRVRLFDRDDLFTVSSDVDVRRAKITLQNLRIDGGGLINGQGGLAIPMALDGPVIGGFTLQADPAGLRALAAGWWPRLEKLATPEGGEPPVGPEEWPQLAGRVKLNLGLKLPTGEASESLPADAVTWTLTAPKPLEVTPKDFTEAFVVEKIEVDGDVKTAAVKTLHMSGPGVRAEAELDVTGFPEQIVVRGSAAASTIDLDVLQDALPKAETAWLAPTWIDDALGVGVANAQGDASEIAPPPANLDLDVGLAAREVKSAGYTLRGVQTRAVLVNQQLRMNDVEATLGTGKITGTAGVDWTKEAPAWETDLIADAIPAAALLEPVAPVLAQALSTQFSGTIDLDGPLSAAPEQILAALTGLADLRAANGSVAAEDLLGPKVSQFLGKNADQWKKLNFNALDAILEVRDGRVFFDELVIRGTTNVTAGGSIGLDGTTDVRLDVRLPAGVTPELGALQPVADFLKDDAGRIAFGVNVTGAGPKPKVQIDLAELQQRATDRGRGAAQDAARDALGDLIDRNRGGLEDALGDVLGGGKAGADSTAEGKTLEDKAKEGLGGLLDKLGGGKKKKGGG